ncbi:transmembrane protein 216-like [Littorina saxatilis]|uniref:Transmembrane protein 216 n=1 Tax=Littorina saxatilis TaxID=31220 RepID=A0AAN9BLK3_9CAEN
MAAPGQTQTASQQRGRVQVVHSSLPYQILLYLNSWYFALFFVCELLIFIFKGETLPFADGVLAAEIILVFLMAGVEILRIFFGKKGNLTEQIVGVVISVLLSIPALFGALFLLLWQTYVLRVEVILSGIQIAFIGLQLIFGVISIITFARAAPY